ncbi:MAG: hypothetical protein HGA65_16345, partial [Oscillochloris sp.]|nr:hypothetical protein [Oscillochloris sp.]
MTTHAPWPPSLVAYDRVQARELLRHSTAQHLRDALRGGNFGAALSPEERAELDALLTAWVQRALGYVFLRDAMLVDEQRGAQIFGLICAGLTRDHVTLTPEQAVPLRARGMGDLAAADLADLARREPPIAQLVGMAEREG